MKIDLQQRHDVVRQNSVTLFKIKKFLFFSFALLIIIIVIVGVSIAELIGIDTDSET